MSETEKLNQIGEELRDMVDNFVKENDYMDMESGKLNTVKILQQEDPKEAIDHVKSKFETFEEKFADEMKEEDVLATYGRKESDMVENYSGYTKLRSIIDEKISIIDEIVKADPTNIEVDSDGETIEINGSSNGLEGENWEFSLEELESIVDYLSD